MWVQLVPVPDFAFRAGLRYHTVRDWLRPTLGTYTLRAVQQLAAGLGVDPMVLLGEVPEGVHVPSRPPTVYEVRALKKGQGLRTARSLTRP